MENSKLAKSNNGKTVHNLAVVSHCPSQQTATIVMVEKHSVFSGIFKNFPISNQEKKSFADRKKFLVGKSSSFLLLSEYKKTWPD